ncbi:hypothetical protein P8452_76170 [Trifolium repens]|nr:hypothetical protein P8452_76170 [Trifolium repens]
MNLLKRHLDVEENIIQLNFDKTKGCHIKYNQLQAVYVQNKDAALAAEKENKPMEEIVVYRERIHVITSGMGHISYAENECVEIGYQLERNPPM